MVFHEDSESVMKNEKNCWDHGPTWPRMSIITFRAILAIFGPIIVSFHHVYDSKCFIFVSLFTDRPVLTIGTVY